MAAMGHLPAVAVDGGWPDLKPYRPLGSVVDHQLQRTTPKGCAANSVHRSKSA
jgi:hypothetical protein